MTATPRVLVFGNACTDRVYHVEALPRPGETLVAARVTTDLGGKGLNQAIAARRAGADVFFIAPVGRDIAGTEICDLLEREGLSAAGLVQQDGPSDSSLVLVDASGENMIVSNTRLIAALKPDSALALIEENPPDAVLLQGNASFETTAAIAGAARLTGARVVLNAAPFDARFADLANLMHAAILNVAEACSWTGTSNAREAACQVGCQIAVVTCGADGCMLSVHGGPAQSIPAPQVMGVDSVGAGDVFTGVFLDEWLRSDDPVRAARLAVHAASDKVTRRGTILAFPTGAAIATMREKLGLAS